MILSHLLGIISPTIFKRDLVDKLYNISKELTESTIPSYQSANDLFQRWEFKSKEVKRLIPTYQAIVKKRQGNIITTNFAVLKNMVKMVDKMKSQVEKTFEDKTTNTALTYKKAQYLQFIDSCNFYTGYTRELLNYIVVCETGTHDTGTTLNKSLSEAQKSVVESYFNNFCMLTNVFNQEAMHVMKLLEDVPDILIIPENIPMVEAAHGVHKVDPLKMNFIAANKNPFYAKAMRDALLDHQKYEKALEERELLRLRLLNLQHILENTQDPVIEKEIAVYQDRIQKLDFQIKKEQEKYE